MYFEAVPMGFETIAPASQKPQTYFEAVPMGFETSSLEMNISQHLILKQSLWDLKQFVDDTSSSAKSILKQSLWDLKLACLIPMMECRHHFEAVPMGFETLRGET